MRICSSDGYIVTERATRAGASISRSRGPDIIVLDLNLPV